MNDPEIVAAGKVQPDNAMNIKQPDRLIDVQEDPVDNDPSTDEHDNSGLESDTTDTTSSTLVTQTGTEVPAKAIPRRKSLRKNAAMSYEYFFSTNRIRKFPAPSKDKKKNPEKSPPLKDTLNQPATSENLNTSRGDKSKYSQQDEPQENENLTKEKKCVGRKKKIAGKQKLPAQKIVAEVPGSIGSEMVSVNQGENYDDDDSGNDLPLAENPDSSNSSVKRKRNHTQSNRRSESSSPNTSNEEITEIAEIPPPKKSKQFSQRKESESPISDTNSVIPLEDIDTPTGYAAVANRASSIVTCDAWSSAESTVFTPATRFLTPSKNVTTSSRAPRSKTSPLTVQCPRTPSVPRPVVLPPLTPPSILNTSNTSHTSASPMYGCNQTADVIPLDPPVQMGRRVQQGLVTHHENMQDQYILSTVRPPPVTFQPVTSSPVQRAHRTSTSSPITDSLTVNIDGGSSSSMTLPPLQTSPGGGKIIGVKTITEVIDIGAEEDGQGDRKRENWRRIHPMEWSVSIL